jgi:hypothetical protein
MSSQPAYPLVSRAAEDLVPILLNDPSQLVPSHEGVTRNIIDFVTVSPPPSTEFHDSATITLSFKEVNLGNHMTDLSHLAPGPYIEPIIVVSPDSTLLLTVPLTLTFTSPQPPAITSIVNGTSFFPGPVAPGEIASILGSSLGAYTGDIARPAAPSLNLPGDLGGASVYFNGSPAALFYVQSGQINAVVPGSVADLSSVSVVVNQGGAQSTPFTIPVTATAPGNPRASRFGSAAAQHHREYQHGGHQLRGVDPAPERL